MNDENKGMKKNSNETEGIVINKRIKRITGLYLTMFLTVILLISLYINVSSFRTQFVSNELSFYSISGGRVVDTIENGLLYGKSLDKFYGIEQLLQSWSDKNQGVVDIKLLSADKEEIYYQLNNEAGDSAVNDQYESIYLEIKDSGDSTIGYINIVIDLADRLNVLYEKQNSLLKVAGMLLIAGVAAVVVFCRKSDYLNTDSHIDKKKILSFMLVLILILQLSFTAYSSVLLRGFYIEISNNTKSEIQSLIQGDINKVIDQGVSYEQIYDFESYADDVINKAPIIESITLDGEKLSVTVSETHIESAIRRMLTDMLTVLIISMFIAAEIVNHMLISINRKIQQISGRQYYDKELSIRVSSFLIHMACYLPISFIPMMMNQLTGGNSSDFILGLPVMILFATGLIFTMIAGSWSQKYGWKKLLLTGVGLVVLSSLIAGAIQNAAVLIIARGLYGAAYALVYIAIREFAAETTDRQDRSKGLAQVTAGLYAGINIGAVLGSMLVESLRFSGVFLISAVLGLIALFVVKNHCVASADIETKNEECVVNNEQPENEIKEKEVTDNRKMIAILKNKDMIRLSLFIIAPLAISTLFFEYFLPIYAIKADISSADIGRAFLFNGIAIAYIAPLLVKYFTGKLNEKLSLFLFSILMAIGFFVFGIWGGVLSILAASAIMGIAEGTALVSQNMIMLDLDIARKAGTGRMLSAYATVRKLSQTAGPQIFALCMMLGYQSGMIVIGIIIAVCSVIYFLGSREDGGDKI